MTRAASETVIIPGPKVLRWGGGSFRFPNPTLITSPAAKDGRRAARDLATLLSRATGLTCRASATSKERRVVMRLAKRVPDLPKGDEAYAIHITPDEVVLEATAVRGLAHAGHALVDLITRDGPDWLLRSCEVRDWPDFAFRGFMADPARRFIPLPELERQVDLLARNRFTHFHLHLADAESFTLPTRRCPRLSEPPRHSAKGPHGVYTGADSAQRERMNGTMRPVGRALYPERRDT